MRPLLSKAWSDSSLTGNVSSVQTHYQLLKSESLSEEEMKLELAVPRFNL